MFRKYVIIILAAFMVFGLSACTSKKSADDSADVEQGAIDESIEAADATENNDDLATEEAPSDAPVADMGGTDDLAPTEKIDEGGAPPSGDQAASNDLMETPPGDTPPPADAAAPTDAPPPVADAGSMDAPPPVVEPTPEPVASEPRPVASLQKIKAQPYKEGKTLVNAVYLARKGDSPESISQKVFGNKDKVKELCKVNSYNCSRTVKVGDKFYYNSPQRPTDDTVIKVFYEDAGIAPQTYVSVAGDNIRKVGKTLLGHDRSWMEIWATNEVESKGDLDEGTSLKYWPASEDAAPAQTMAQTETPAPPAADPSQGGEMPPPTDQAMAPPPDMGGQVPPDQAAQPPPPPADTLPPPPDQAAVGQIEPPAPPPPPPPVDMADANKEPAAVDGGDMQNPDQTMALGIGAILLLAAAALFISIRKKRARRQIDFNTTTQTQIE